jgi:hypothetical protein
MVLIATWVFHDRLPNTISNQTKESVEGLNLTHVTADAFTPSKGQASNNCPNRGRRYDDCGREALSAVLVVYAPRTGIFKAVSVVVVVVVIIVIIVRVE